MSINRTYQGRISGAFRVSGKKAIRGVAIVNTEWQPLLANHLEIFQAGTNYYLAAFAACARGSKVTALKNLESKVRQSWKSHDYRKSGAGTGFQYSLHSHLPHLVGPVTTFDEFADRLVADAQDPNLLHLAVEALLTDLGGESTIQQGGRSYLPYFCSPNTLANFPRSRLLLERDLSKQTLPAQLHSPQPISIDKLRKNYDVHHFANLSKGQEPIKGTKLKSSAKEWLTHLQTEKLITPSQLETWLKESEALPEETYIPHYNGASAKGAEKNRLYAFLFCKLLSPSQERLDVLRSTYPSPKEPTKKKAAKKAAKTESLVAEKKHLAAEQEARLRSLGDDPIELARGGRRAIFASFTNQLGQAPFEDGPQWVEFDIATFKQALTALNQINQKTEDRKAELAELKNQISYYTNKKGSPRNTDEPVTFHTDPRYSLLEELHQAYNQKLHTDFAEDGVTMRRATIKGWPQIRDRFVKALEKNPDATTEALIETAVTASQKRTKNIGSSDLFRLLAEEKFRPIWSKITEENAESFRKNEWSQDALTDYVTFCLLQAEATHLSENLEVNLTPANLVQSRRPLPLSDLGGASKVVHRQHPDDGTSSIITSIYAHDSESKTLKETRIELTYSAPRLERDSLSGPENRSLLQPLMKGLGLECPPLEKVFPKAKDLAVNLMPDWFTKNIRNRTTKPDRFLLNFPARLETEWISDALGKARLWDSQQFNGPNDDPLHLHWPETMKPADQKNAWWTKKEIIEKGFTVASFDLGVRTAAACAIYQVTCDKSSIPESKLRFTRTLGSSGNHTWFAYPLSREMIRLSGEDRVALHTKRPGKGKAGHSKENQHLIERSGKRGRKADPVETPQFKNHLETLANILPDWLHQEAAKSLPYLLRQNRLLLRTLKALLGHLAWCHRLFIKLKAGEELAFKSGELNERLHEIFTPEKSNDEQLAALSGQIQSQRTIAKQLLLDLANRILPLQKFHWELKEGALVELTNTKGDPEKFQPYTLTKSKNPLQSSASKIRGQGGLSAERIEDIDDLRRRASSLQRELNRIIGVEPTIGFGRNSGSVPDAAPELLDRLDKLKDQKQKQTAHFILTRALGLRLKEGDAKDADRPDYVHGEYEPIPGAKVADMIVIENLERYRTDQGRTRAGNRQLMQWSHRAVTGTLRELTAPYGIPVLAVSASYSSKFCATTARPGFRAVELSPKNKNHHALRHLLESTKPAEKNFATQVDKLLTDNPDNPRLKILVPSDGGPIFVPAFDPKQQNQKDLPRSQADLNAAQNLALRAIAPPAQLCLLHKVRIKADKGKLLLRCENIREKTALNPKAELQSAISSETIPPELLGKKFSTFFYLGSGDGVSFAPNYDHFTTTLPNGEKIHLASNRSLWPTVTQAAPACLIAINNPALAKLNLPLLSKPSPK